MASIKSVTIKDQGFLLYIKFDDGYLEKNIDNAKAIGMQYQLIDCVESMMREPT